MKGRIVNSSVASTAILAASHPIIAALQTQGAGMSDLKSITNRAITTIATYLGLGEAYANHYRPKLQRIAGIGETSPLIVKYLHDSVTNGTFNALITPPFLAVSGEHDLEKIAYATALQIGYGFITGAPIGCAIDHSRQFRFGAQPASRKKKTLVALLLATSLGTMGAVYALPNHQFASDIVNYIRKTP